jgi:hypothetical protein
LTPDSAGKLRLSWLPLISYRYSGDGLPKGGADQCAEAEEGPQVINLIEALKAKAWPGCPSEENARKITVVGNKITEGTSEINPTNVDGFGFAKRNMRARR